MTLPLEFGPTFDAIVDSLGDAYRDEDRDVEGVRYFRDRIMDAWLINEQVRALALAPEVLETLAYLFGRRPLPFQTLNFRYGTQQRLHSDASHFNSDPVGFVAAVWVALEDITEDNGPVVYYPGSHRLEEISAGQVGTHRAAQTSEAIERSLAASGIAPRHGLLRRGQAMIWVGDLIHGGAPVLAPEATRHSQATHYFFEGCRYWVPKSSTADDVTWRHPRWIA
ncbi:phytanoyl-CoA dioxygenase family protein [Nocardia puris]|uniref:phytanoyl-CoA dioxygenase family protein n=1 Tax=Nocardia puris TaxID=208602 RepID=UPI0018937A6C|nr:phytanoyl-CoA dioxygenase family protein [Nocardia puris]MBF6212198.1 phytanoyl-CoA dioxygenase family protein [Nocardia puris]